MAASVDPHGELAVHGGGRAAAADRPAYALQLTRQLEGVARLHQSLEAHVVDASEEGELAAVLLLGEHRRRCLGALEDGRDELAARAMVALGTVLVHGVRGSDEEAIGLLHGAFVIARECGAPAVAAQAAHELGLVETLESLIGGADRIFAGSGSDILLGGNGGDILIAGEGRNIVIGDSGYIDWTAGDAGRVYAAATFAGGVLSGDEVRVGGRLRQSAACLVLNEHVLGYQMRQMLAAAGHEAPAAIPSL